MKKIRNCVFIILIFVLFCNLVSATSQLTIGVARKMIVAVLGTTFSYTYDTATPAGSDDPSEADDRMREIKAAVQERLAVDHKFSLTGTEVSATDSGEHTKITYNVTISDPTQVASKAHLYMQSDELRYQDDTNSAFDLTDTGTLNILSSDLVGTLANDTYFSAVDNAGTGTVDLIKAGTNDLATLPDSAEMASNAAPVEDEAIANKKYVDDQDLADHPAYTGGESHTDGSGLITKMGYVAIGATTGTVTFGTAFPTGVVSVSLTLKHTGAVNEPVVVTDLTTADIDWWASSAGITGFYWIAIGY